MDNLTKVADTETRLIRLISDKLEIGADSISTSSNLISDLGADSLDVIELMMIVEKEFGIKVLEEDSKELQTVGDIVNFINNNIQSKAS